MNRCRVCQQTLDGSIFRSARDVSITSLCEVRRERTEVSFCAACGHLQTDALADLATFYDQEYKILIDSEDEDQLYALVNGRKIFRTEHQVETLLSKVTLAPGAKVLDYGCAKSSTLRRLAARRPDLDPHVFDVSEMYIPFWRSFIPPTNWATYAPKAEWAGRFDLITSFFALEHVADPGALVRTVAGLLKPGGHFYGIVPNVYANTCDFVVADHVNHFSAPSLWHLMRAAGLELVSLDSSAHTAAWVLVAKKGTLTTAEHPAPEEVAVLARQAREMAGYWTDFSNRVQAFERQHARHATAAIYGSGFYGTCIATSLADFGKVTCFLDQNPHRQKQTLLGRKILPPDQLPPGTGLVYVGLNPRHARAAIADIAPWRNLAHEYFFT